MISAKDLGVEPAKSFSCVLVKPILRVTIDSLVQIRAIGPLISYGLPYPSLYLRVWIIMTAEVEQPDQGQEYHYDPKPLHVAFEFDDASTSDSDGTESMDYVSSETSEDREFVASDT